MTDRMVWLEAALNGPWGRELQHKIPISVREIAGRGKGKSGGYRVITFYTGRTCRCS